MTEEAEQGALKLDIDTSLLRVDQCRHGTFLSLKSDVYIGKSLAEYGEWGESEVNLLAQLLRPDDIVIDAGANIGTHTIAFARIVGPRGRVYAFEPQPRIHQILTANVVLNGLSHVTPINSGLSDETGWIAFPELQYGGTANFGGISLEMVDDFARKSAATRRQKVAVAPLDEILSLDRLRLIKADIEGMEAEMLRGARQTIERLRPALYLECREPDEAGKIMHELEGLEYSCFWHLSHAFNPENWRGAAQEEWSKITDVNLLCVPPNITVQGMTPATGPEDHPRITLAAKQKQS
jgi:FkbM family methyltransferase